MSKKYSEFKRKRTKEGIQVIDIEEDEKKYEDIIDDFGEIDIDLQYNLKFLKENNNEVYEKYKNDVKNGKIELTLWTLPTMTEFKKREDEKTRNLSVKPYYIVKGVVSCSRCKCDEMMSFSVQSRGMDEGMTAIYVCTKCQHTFSMS